MSPPPVLGAFPLMKHIREKQRRKKSYLVHPLVASGHEDECQAQGQSGRRPGYVEEGEEQWSSCERCLLASEITEF